jgi:lipopolysaccharide/colanic/teichoic acid biosynthesis glycosyltransferase
VLLSRRGLLVTKQLWILIPVANKADSRRPVFFTQPRVGERGRIFGTLKFRSMVVDAEREVGPIQAAEHDPRVTRVGRILRVSAMDELPQLWNIFRGDMSVVGPRALRPDEVDADGRGEIVSIEKVPGFAERSAVRPGLTGLAQIYARRDVRRRHKFRYDRLYIRRQSFALDVRLIFLSFWITARGAWEVRGRKF